jgi:hypothetical protein
MDFSQPAPALSKDEAAPAPVTEGGKESAAGSLFSSLAAPFVKGAKYVGKQSLAGLFEDFLGNVSEAARAAGKEPPPISGARILFGSDMVDALAEKYGPMISPYSVAKMREREEAALVGKERERAAKVPLLSKEGVKGVMDLAGANEPAPGPISGILGAGARMLSDPTVSMSPFQRGPAMVNIAKAGLPVERDLSMFRGPITAFGAGSGAEAGGDVGEAVDKNVFGGEGTTGRVVGSLGGAVTGGHLNDLRARAVTEAAGKVVSPVVDAAKGVVAAKRAGDERSLWAIFNDRYGDLRAEAKGFLNERVLNQYAEILARDPEAKRKLAEFNDAIEASGGKGQADYSLAQRATTPYLVSEVEQQIPRTKEEVAARSLREEAQKRDVVARFKGLFRRSGAPKAEDITDALEEVRQTHNAKIGAIEDQTRSEKAAIPNWDAPGQPTAFQRGEELRGLAQSEKDASRGVEEALYARPLDAADAARVGINIAPMKDAIGEVVNTMRAAADPASVPKSIRNLGSIFDLMDQYKGKLRLRDANEALGLLSNDIEALRSGRGDPIKIKNLSDILDTVREQTYGSLPPEISRQFAEAQAHHSTLHAPRFKEGVNANVFRESGWAQPGMERIRSEDLPNAWKGETGMQLFDRMFGGNEQANIPRNMKAYQILGEGLESQFNKDVLSKPGTPSPDAFNKWVDAHSAELNRVPQSRDRITQAFNQVATNDQLIKEQHDLYKDVTGHLLSKTVGPDQAKAILAKGLSNPGDMNKLVNFVRETQGTEQGPKALVKFLMQTVSPYTNGEYDPRKLIAVLNAGQPEVGKGIGGAQTLFRQAYGAELGDKHFNNLMAIAELAERQRLTNPKFYRPMGETDMDFIKGASGQSGASWLSYLNNMAQGRISPVYVAGVAGGRFANMQLSKAMRDMQNEALFNPRVSDHVIELMNTDSRYKLSDKGRAALEALKDRAGPDAKDTLQRLIDAGAWPTINAQSARIGGKEAMDEPANKEKERRRAR